MNDITVNASKTGNTAYRVVPDPDDPIILQLDGKLSRVVEISASGFSLPKDIVAAGRRYPYSLDLPTAKVPIGGYVDVLPDTGAAHLQCVFVELTADELDALHHYVLIRQKEAIRSIRASRSGTEY